MTTLIRTPEEARLLEIIRTRSFGTGDFTLASGKKSTVYFNLKPTMMVPEGAFLLAQAFLNRIGEDEADYVGGLEMGAVPIIAALAALAHERGRTNLRTFFVRKKAKDYGAKALIEGLAPGESLAGKKIVMAEDVTTTGGSVLQAVAAAREAGGDVKFAVTVVDRKDGAEDALAAEGVSLRSVFTVKDFV